MSQERYDSDAGLAKLLLLLGFGVVAYTFYSLTISIFHNYQVERTIEDYYAREEELLALRESELEKLQYFKTPQYDDKISKQDLGLYQEGEQVLIIPDEDLIILSTEEEQEESSQAARTRWSNPMRWYKFFVGNNPFKS